jgi:nicotinate-nucleotide pyrophosphorylase (carboxylating)
MIEPETLRRAVRAALEEDLGEGDITSSAVVDQDRRARGRIIAHVALVVAGLPVARETFRQVDAALSFRETCAEGESREAGQALAEVSGSARSILAGERTALNFLQRMCGIATTARRLVGLVSGSGVEISDTRKTAPGLRAFDKYAVRTGGGTSHRAGLFDAVLIKNNHWRLAGGVREAVRRARLALGTGPGTVRRIEIEVGTIPELEEALEAGVEAILLDNMDWPTLQQAVSRARGRVFLEVSGGVLEEDLPRLATLGADRISLGSLTHSVRAADIALQLEAA